MASGDIIKHKGGLIKHVENAISITNKLLINFSPKIKMLFYCPWKLPLTFFKESIEPRITNLSINTTLSFNEALEFVKLALEDNNSFDLIFTEMIGSELGGYEFLKRIKEMETKHGTKSHKVLYTCYGASQFGELSKVTEENLYDKYFHFHTTGSEEIIEYIKQLYKLNIK